MNYPRYASILRNRHFRSLWINQICLQFSYNMVNFTLLLSVWQLTGSTTSTSLLIISLSIPAILFGVVAGLIADSVDRRRVMILTNVVLIGAFVLFIVLPSTVPILLLLAFFMSSVTQFFMPAEASAIPMLTEKKDLLVAQSLFSLTLNASFLLGYALAGPIVVLFGLSAPFFGAVAAVGIGLWFIRKLPRLKALGARNSVPDTVERTKFEIAEGYRFMSNHRFVSIPILILTVAQSLIGVIASLIPGFMEKVVRVPSASASFLVMLPTGLGMVIGSLLVKRLCEFWPRRSIVARAIQIAGMLLILIAMLPIFFNNRPFIVGTGLFFLSILLGLAAVMTQVISITVLQEHTPVAIKGRVFATLNMAISGLVIVPVLLSGRLADVFGIVPVLIVVGFAVLMLGVFAMQYRMLRTRILVP